MVVSQKMKGQLKSTSVVKSGLEYMEYLAEWYVQQPSKPAPGFFQIGGGISGDFPICVVPMINQDLALDPPEGTEPMEAELWGYFCQISEAATSFGSYSG